jgi:hypothetical protein
MTWVIAGIGVAVVAVGFWLWRMSHSGNNSFVKCPQCGTSLGGMKLFRAQLESSLGDVTPNEHHNRVYTLDHYCPHCSKNIKLTFNDYDLYLLVSPMRNVNDLDAVADWRDKQAEKGST